MEKHLKKATKRLMRFAGIHCRDVVFWPATGKFLVQVYLKGAKGYTSIVAKDGKELVQKLKEMRLKYGKDEI